MRLVLLTVAALSSCTAQRQQQQFAPQDPRLVYLPQPYGQNSPYNLGFFDPQFQQNQPGYNFQQPYPRIQPQIILYHGGAAPNGQPFLLQPGGAPPNNFLVPQQPGGPNVFVKNTPQRPVFVAGYPKPAHIPPIEKDAEEVPTNPSQIPPLAAKGQTDKPEKLETFNEDEPTKKQPKPQSANPFNANLQPGQRFFILNGQPLFSNYPYNNQIYPNLRLAHPEAQYGVPKNTNPAIGPSLDNFFVRNGVTGQIDDVVQDADLINPQNYPENLILLNQPSDAPLFRTAEGYQLTKDIKLGEGPLNKNDGQQFELYQGDEVESDDDSVVIDAKYQDETPATTTETESESVSAPEKSGEPTISQAAPGAIALAGPGGVAAAAPRGTAFVGKDGVAVSSPQATAVAGPSKEERSTEKPKKPKRKQ